MFHARKAVEAAEEGMVGLRRAEPTEMQDEVLWKARLLLKKVEEQEAETKAKEEAETQKEVETQERG